MDYHSPMYLFLFLPAALLTYQIVPKKWRGYTLIGFSYLFFWMISEKLLIYLVAATLLTHHIGIWIEYLKGLEKGADSEAKEKLRRQKKAALMVGIISIVGILVILKYYNFFVRNVSSLSNILSVEAPFVEKNIILPIGISFYSLQAIGYILDVYWNKIHADSSLQKTALFLGFFPQIMEGPICRYSDTSETLYKMDSLKLDNIVEGGLRIIWGLFKKMVIADRLSVVVSVLFGHYEEYSGLMIIVAAVSYTVQLYMEFSGSMDVVIGSGRMFGIILPENFRQPFFAKTSTDFWRRWHITLGIWLKNYIFYPVSISWIVKKWNRFGRKHMGKYLTRVGTSALALFPVWFCNGIWHGPRWSYLFYGCYYFSFIMLGIIFEPVRNKIIQTLHINPKALYYRVFQTIKLLSIVFTGELFFRADGLKAGVKMFLSIFRNFQTSVLTDGTLLNLGLDAMDYWVVGIGIIIVLFLEIAKENGVPIIQETRELSLPVRWGLYYGLIFAVIIFGAYGEGYQVVDLIYAGF